MWSYICWIWDTSGMRACCVRSTKRVRCVIQHVTCALFSNSFSFLLQLTISPRICVVHIISETVLKEIIARIHVRWTWWPGPPTPRAFWTSIRWDTATKHPAARPRRHSLYVYTRLPAGRTLCPWPAPGVARITLFCCCCRLNTIQGSVPWVLDFWSHTATHILQNRVASAWLDFQSFGISGSACWWSPKWASLLPSQIVSVGGYTDCKTSRQNSRFHCLVLQCANVTLGPCKNTTPIPVTRWRVLPSTDWEHGVAGFLGLQSSALSRS